jgi:hypothetical protein
MPDMMLLWESKTDMPSEKLLILRSVTLTLLFSQM